VVVKKMSLSKVFKSPRVLSDPLIIRTENLQRIVHEDGSIEITRENLEELLEKTRKDADIIIKTAHAQAKSIVDSATKQVPGIKENAQREGFEIGLEEGKESVLKESENILINIRKIINSLHEEIEKRYKENEKEIIRLAVAIASEIINKELSVSEDIVYEITRKAIEKSTEKSKMNICVNPDDYEYLKSCHDKLMDEFKSVNMISFTADRRISRGGCVIETSSGSVDARVEQQIELTEKELLDE
jgi:flagellar assembly protein FliH